MKNIPVIIDNSKFSKEDKEQLSILFENAGRKLLDILGQKFGKEVADAYKIYISASDPVPAVLQEKTATLSTSAAVVVTPDSGYDGLSKVTVPKVDLQTKTVTPSTTSQEITADTGYNGLEKVTVSAVTAAIDENIVAGNIKKDVVILGVTGTYEG